MVQMELLQLKYFLTVARCEHVTEGAGKAHVTQSSLSKTIQRLEDDLGVPLFDRIGRKSRLNDFEEHFFSELKKPYLNWNKESGKLLTSPIRIRVHCNWQ